MNIKKLWTLLLLSAMSFSVVHAYAFSALDEDHCSVNEYVQELSAPTDHGDICDTHCQYHTSFIMPVYYLLPEYSALSDALFDNNERMSSHQTTSLFRPPIFS